ncbi:hypothetical protein [Kribbella sp. DT2]|uniref:hypothetical protein n=1 Tax=Kribbella sp. DT2 TaxID=3393427 RepID=UPI003CE9544E
MTSAPLPSSVAGTTTQEVDYFRADHVLLANWFADSDEAWSVLDPEWTSLQDAAASLTPAAPISRYAFVELGGWTLMLNNGPNGTDVGILPSYAARESGCRAVRAVYVADDDPGYAARIFEVYGPDTDSPLALRRSVGAANDGGRWVFETSGPPFAFEDLAAYRRRRRSDRLSGVMVHHYLRQLGVPVDTEPAWNSAVLVERRDS